MKRGERVAAAVEITEAGFDRESGVWIHALPGGTGTVVDTFPDGWVMVRFDASGTAAQCHVSELTPPETAVTQPLGARLPLAHA